MFLSLANNMVEEKNSNYNKLDQHFRCVTWENRSRTIDYGLPTNLNELRLIQRPF